jgi:hypothetical protein
MDDFNRFPAIPLFDITLKNPLSTSCRGKPVVALNEQQKGQPQGYAPTKDLNKKYS